MSTKAKDYTFIKKSIRIFDVNLAVKIGFIGAVTVQQIHFWASGGMGVNYKGRTYIYNSLQQRRSEENLPFLSKNQLEYAFKKLVELNVLFKLHGKVVNLGSGLVRGNLIIDVPAMAMQDNDELYQLHLMGGDDSSFTNTIALATIEIGCKEATESNFDSKLGRYVVPFENEKNGVTYDYLRIRHAISGTTPSINYTARLEKDLPVRGTVSATATTTTT